MYHGNLSEKCSPAILKRADIKKNAPAKRTFFVRHPRGYCTISYTYKVRNEINYTIFNYGGGWYMARRELVLKR